MRQMIEGYRHRAEKPAKSEALDWLCGIADDCTQMKFSERQGFKKPREILQTDSMDDGLRNPLWNVFMDRCLNASDSDFLYHGGKGLFRNFCSTLWHDHLKLRVDGIPDTVVRTIEQIRHHFFACDWYEVYDFVEFVANRPIWTSAQNAIQDFNKVLTDELSAYRFVAGKLAPISSEQEKLAIEGAISQTSNSYSTTSAHLRQAIDLLARRPTPDYRNSIKESISAVEALCAIVTGDPKATLGQALKTFDTQAKLHGGLRSAFEKLYGYTSDANGIRHALMEESNLEQEDAVFMLVACSAFVSYLIAKQSRRNPSTSAVLPQH